MGSGSLRFAQASNVRLDAVLRDLGPVPDDVRDALRDATLTAFENVVTTCLDREVAWLLLAGNTLDAADTGLRARAALRDGLECLDEAGIPTVIAPGADDPLEVWSRIGSLPPSVSVLGLDGSTIPIERDGDVVALISDGRPARNLGRGTRVDASHDAYRIEVTGSELEFGESTADFVALLGSGPRRTVSASNPVVHHAGHVESRSDAEQGLGGMSLVTVDRNREAEPTFVPTGVLRRERCNIEFGDDFEVGSKEDIDRAADQLVRCLKETGATGHETVRLVGWHVHTGGDWLGRHREAVERQFAAKWAKVGDGVVLHRWQRAVTPIDDELYGELIEQVRRGVADPADVLHRVAATIERSPATERLVRRLGHDVGTKEIVGRGEELATDWLNEAIHGGHAA